MFEQLRQGHPEIHQDGPDDVVRLVRPEGAYTIMYGIHTLVQDPRQLPEKVNGIFLETGENNYIDNDPVEIIRKFKEGRLITLNLKPVVQYTALFKTLEERKVPIYFADLCFTDFNSLNLVIAATVGVTLAETGTGIYLAQDLVRKPGFSRRNVVQGVAALWGLSQLATIIPALPLSEPSTLVHPEMTVLKQVGKEQADFLIKTLREVSIAHKLSLLMQTLGINPELAVAMGKGHKDTEERVGLGGRITQDPEERLAYLGSVKQALSQSVVAKSLYQIVECQFNGQDWEVTNIQELPELKKLVA